MNVGEMRMLEVVANALYHRLLRGRGLDPDRRRDIEAECGHPKTFSAAEYADLIDRDAIADRCNAIIPAHTWALWPQVYEDENEGRVTPFEAAWDAVGKSLAGGSLLAEESGAAVWPWLAEADVLCGVGRFGLVLLGLDDGMPLAERPRRRAGQRLTYLRAFGEHHARINQYDRDPSSPRYGQPTEYLIDLRDPAANPDDPRAVSSEKVHWERAIHVVDGPGPVFARPRLKPLLPRIMDLRKVLGSDAEGYWQWGFPSLVLETPPEFGSDVAVNDQKAKDEIEKFINGLQRWFLSRGATAKTLNPSLADPTPHVMTQLQAICTHLDVPMRVFLGSERGELASSQDARKWHETLRACRRAATLRLAAPLVDRLILLGVLPAPQRYYVWWPDGETQTEAEKAAVALSRTQALVAYVNSLMNRVILSPLDYLTRFHGFTTDEATAVIDAAERYEASRPAPEPADVTAPDAEGDE